MCGFKAERVAESIGFALGNTTNPEDERLVNNMNKHENFVIAGSRLIKFTSCCKS